MEIPTSADQLDHPWPHRLAWALAIAVFPLIWMGGTVTTYDAGMAVPDWPTTYSSWFYPVHLWLAVWDVFLEHGHRLLAQLVGILAVLLAVAIWRSDERKWMRWIGVAIVLGVVAQGTLGGIRVWAGTHEGMWAWANDRLLARIHGCMAPLYFGLCTAVVAWTSRQWRTVPIFVSAKMGLSPLTPEVACEQAVAHKRLSRLAWFVTVAIYLEIVLGALLRRPSDLGIVGDVKLWGWLQTLSLGQAATWFELCVWLKVLNAVLIAIGSTWLVVGVLRRLGPLSLWERVRVRAVFAGSALTPGPSPACGRGEDIARPACKMVCGDRIGAVAVGGRHLGGQLRLARVVHQGRLAVGIVRHGTRSAAGAGHDRPRRHRIADAGCRSEFDAVANASPPLSRKRERGRG